MSQIFTLSEASSIAIHSLVMIARSEYRISTKKIAEITRTSEHHVAKVMQKLVKAGIIRSKRGPDGGFILQVDPDEITLLDVYELIEGKIIIQPCQLQKPVCPFDKCLMDGKLNDMTREFIDYLDSQKLSSYTQ